MKLKKVTFTTEKGELKELIYQPIMGTLKDDEIVCDRFCPYSSEICSKLRNPQKESDEKSSFMDFCGEIGLREGDDPELTNYIPAKGTIESNLGDMNSVFETILKENRYVRMNDVIDSVCQGSCPLYNKEHTKCIESNDCCVLQDLIKKSNHGNE